MAENTADAADNADAVVKPFSTASRPFDIRAKDHARCIFCRGSRCKRCGEHAYTSQDTPAIAQLHSSWIGDSILAMQRPSDAKIDSADLLGQFQSHRLTAIFNLTEPGEHPYCGHGVIPSSGFPYNPERFMGAGSKLNACYLT
jgi:protein tyrosine phosphatase domain-containing protein 1